MSNKIVQLKDKTFTDNIYPIAGGMAADSITTQMLKDSSVTSDKIDSATLTTDKYADGSVTNAKIDWSTLPVTYGFPGTGVENLRYTIIGKYILLKGLITVNAASTTRNIPIRLGETSQFNVVPAVALNTNVALQNAYAMVKFANNADGVSTDVTVTASAAITYASINCWLRLA